MSFGEDANAIGSTRLVNGVLWTVVDVRPIRIKTTSTATGER